MDIEKLVFLLVLLTINIISVSIWVLLINKCVCYDLIKADLKAIIKRVTVGHIIISIIGLVGFILAFILYLLGFSVAKLSKKVKSILTYKPFRE